MTCGDCIHLCANRRYEFLLRDDMEKSCGEFEDKSLYIKLPCSIGDTVYFLSTECDGCKDERFACEHSCKKPTGIIKVNSTVIKQFHLQEKSLFDRMSDSDSAWSSKAHYFYLRDIGKTVFLTQEEAEQALKEREQNKKRDR